MYDLERLESTIAHGVDWVPNTNGKYPPCLPKYWFYTPCCVQLAADTFQIPISVYPDIDESVNRNNNSGPPLLYVPFSGPKPKQEPLPLLMQFVSGNHWSTLRMNKSIKMDWPVIENFVIEACRKMGQTQDLRKRTWRYLSIKKPDNSGSKQPETIILD